MMSRLEIGKSVPTGQVNFVCQRCSQPLKLEPSFSAIDAQTYGEVTAPLTNPSCADDTVDLTSSAGAIKTQYLDDECEAVRYIPAIPKFSSIESGNGFTLIGESEPQPGESISRRLRVNVELFDILSGQSEIDHPLCEECTDALLDKLDFELKSAEDECKVYRDYLEKLNTTSENVDETALDEELRQLEAEEEALKAQLEEVEGKTRTVMEDIAKEKERAKQLAEEENRHFKEFNEYKRQLLEYEDAQQSVDNQLHYAKTQLDRLVKTNVFNSTFHIWHSGHFGTINGFRLGRLPSIPVEWNEINAAWGQTALLLYSLANKMNLTFKRYRLVPYGNHSYLESLAENSKELPLHSSGGFKFFWDTKFDLAMVAFLDCLHQFKEAVERGDSGFCLPYKMEKGKIEDSKTGLSYSVKIQFNSEEQWTKALKFMLTNLKWGLAWVSSQFANK